MAPAGSEMALVLFWCFLAVGIVPSVSAIKCYQCDSNRDDHCTEIFDHENSNIQPSECRVFESQYCVKTTGMYKGSVGTHRFCASHNWGNVCEIVKRKGDIREYRSCIYYCSSEGCNGASTINYQWFALVFPLVAVFVFRSMD